MALYLQTTAFCSGTKVLATTADLYITNTVTADTFIPICTVRSREEGGMHREENSLCVNQLQMMCPALLHINNLGDRNAQ